MSSDKKWLKELARDFIAFGSIPFLVITIARVSVITIYYPMQFIIGSILFFILRAIFGGSLHAGLGLLLIIFISLYYESWLFAIFAAFIYTGLISSLFYLQRVKTQIFKGILLGAISTAITYLIVRAIFF